MQHQTASCDKKWFFDWNPSWNITGTSNCGQIPVKNNKKTNKHSTPFKKGHVFLLGIQKERNSPGGVIFQPANTTVNSSDHGQQFLSMDDGNWWQVCSWKIWRPHTNIILVYHNMVYHWCKTYHELSTIVNISRHSTFLTAAALCYSDGIWFDFKHVLHSILLPNNMHHGNLASAERSAGKMTRHPQVDMKWSRVDDALLNNQPCLLWLCNSYVFTKLDRRTPPMHSWGLPTYTSILSWSQSNQ